MSHVEVLTFCCRLLGGVDTLTVRPTNKHTYIALVKLTFRQCAN